MMLEKSCATVISPEIELQVDYDIHPAEEDIGMPRAIEVTAIKVGNVRLPFSAFTKQQLEAIEQEILEATES